VLVHLPLLSNKQNKNQHPPPLYISQENTSVPWNFRRGAHGIFLDDFATNGSDFDTADGNSCKDYYSDDDELFLLHGVSRSELHDIKRAWNAQTRAQEPFIPTEIFTENGAKSSNSAQFNEDHSNDEGGEIPKGASIAQNYVKEEKLGYVSFDIETAVDYVELSRYAIFEIFAKYGVFKALYLMIEARYELFDTFSTKTKHKTFIWWVGLDQRR